MTRLTPYSGLSAQRLTAMINQDNRSSLRLGIDFTLGLPQEFEGEGRNTQVVMTPVPGTRYKGPETVYYKRLALDALNRLPEGSVLPVEIPQGPFWIHDILPQINEGLGLNLTAEEVVNQYHEEEFPSYPLRIDSSKSLAWVDFEFTFVVVRKQSPVDIPLTEVIPNNYLSGLEYREAQ